MRREIKSCLRSVMIVYPHWGELWLATTTLSRHTMREWNYWLSMTKSHNYSLSNTYLRLKRMMAIGMTVSSFKSLIHTYSLLPLRMRRLNASIRESLRWWKCRLQKCEVETLYFFYSFINHKLNLTYIIINIIYKHGVARSSHTWEFHVRIMCAKWKLLSVISAAWDRFVNGQLLTDS